MIAAYLSASYLYKAFISITLNACHMKRYTQPGMLAFALIASLVFPACSKMREYIEQHASAVSKYCRIDSLVVKGDGPTAYYQFSYNDAGNPVAMQLVAPPGDQFGFDLHFRYDKRGRLSDNMQTPPGETLVLLCHRYSYPSPTVIIDSLYEYGGYIGDANPPNDPSVPRLMHKLLLDQYGRIVKILSYDPDVTTELSYDKNGNLIIAGVFYDNKVNIYQTNKVWQLIFNNYSRNNPTAPPPGTPPGPQTTPAAYNAYELPTKLFGPFQDVFGLYYTELDVTYSCDVPFVESKP
jgi:hypothetical protein